MARERCFCDHKFGFFSFFQELDQQSRHLGANLCSFSRAKPCSSSQGKKLDAPLPEKGEEAVGGRKREGGDTGGRAGGREGVGVSVTLSARTTDRQNPTGSQSTHFHFPDPIPDPSHPERPPPPTPPPRRDLRSRCSLAASGAQPPKCAPPADAPSLRLRSLRGRLERGSWTGVRVEPKPASERGESL